MRISRTMAINWMYRASPRETAELSSDYEDMLSSQTVPPDGSCIDGQSTSTSEKAEPSSIFENIFRASRGMRPIVDMDVHSESSPEQKDPSTDFKQKPHEQNHDA